MSTRGFVAVVKDGRYFAHYQHTDMYPSGHPKSLGIEAADITRRGEWDSVIDAWTHKAWVYFADSDLPHELLDAITHPDGLYYQRSDWAYGQRPRLPGVPVYHEDGTRTIEVDHKWSALARNPRQNPDTGNVIYGRPSWRQGARMGTMLKHIVNPDGWEEYSVVLDADNREIVVLKHYYVNSPVSESKDFTQELFPLAVSKLDNAPSLEALGERAEVSDEEFDIEFYEARAGVPRGAPTSREWSFATFDGLEDGMTQRPEGFPPFAEAA